MEKELLDKEVDKCLLEGIGHYVSSSERLSKLFTRDFVNWVYKCIDNDADPNIYYYYQLLAEEYEEEHELNYINECNYNQALKRKEDLIEPSLLLLDRLMGLCDELFKEIENRQTKIVKLESENSDLITQMYSILIKKWGDQYD